jgi:type IX secretion system PorP/SprF family membrane protein
MKTKNIFSLSLWALCSTLVAQDLHFSNPEYSPLILNPALAGANSGMQANLNYRTQWGKLGDSYRSTAASFDARITADNSSKNNVLAVGLNFFNDKAGNLGMMSNNLALSVANHFKIDSRNKFSLAINAGYCQRSIQSADGIWASQFNGVVYDAGVSSGEEFNNQSFGFFDAGAGILYSYNRKVKGVARNSDQRVNIGLAAFHLNRPNFSFVEIGNERMNVRYSAFIDAEISIEGTDGVLLPSVFYHKQGSASQILFGTFYKYKLNSGSNYTGYEKPFSFSLGVFGRLKDAFIAKMILEWDQFAIGYSYDVTLSGLSKNTNGFGASEIFVRFNMGDGGGFRYGSGFGGKRR